MSGGGEGGSYLPVMYTAIKKTMKVPPPSPLARPFPSQTQTNAQYTPQKERKRNNQEGRGIRETPGSMLMHMCADTQTDAELTQYRPHRKELGRAKTKQIPFTWMRGEYGLMKGIKWEEERRNTAQA